MLHDSQASDVCDEDRLGPVSSETLPAVPFVVVIDDHPDSLLLTSHVLDSLNIKYLAIQSAAELFAIIKDIQPDIILLDILLPDINGFEVFDILRLGYRLTQVPIIATTALGNSETQKKIEARGFADYLIKPFELEQLKAAIIRHLEAFEITSNLTFQAVSSL